MHTSSLEAAIVVPQGGVGNEGWMRQHGRCVPDASVKHMCMFVGFSVALRTMSGNVCSAEVAHRR